MKRNDYDIIRGLTPSFFMSRMRDPLVHGFWCVGYVLNGEDKVATFFQMESAQEALVRMMKMGVECLSLIHISEPTRRS